MEYSSQTIVSSSRWHTPPISTTVKLSDPESSSPYATAEWILKHDVVAGLTHLAVSVVDEETTDVTYLWNRKGSYELRSWTWVSLKMQSTL